MDKNVVYKIQDYLKYNHIADLSESKSKMTLRAEGKTFTMQEHVEGMILALISGQNKWCRVERQLDNIKKLFCDYEANEILKNDGEYYFNGLKKLGANGRFAERQMAEVCHNVRVLQSIESDYESVDAFLTGSPVNVVVKKLSDSNSKYKLNQMSIALVCEYLRNVGVDTAKPDEHMRRMLGAERLGVSVKKDATEYEVISEFYRLSKETGMWAADIDYLFWCYCAEEKAEICSKNPRCSKCVIREFCNKSCKKSIKYVNDVFLPQNVTLNIQKEKNPVKNDELNEYRLKVAEVINEYVQTYGHDEVKHKSEIRKMLTDKIGYLHIMYQESDMCYNKTNKANLGTYSSDVILFEACDKKGYFKILGQNYPYTGDVVWTKKKDPNEIVGHWDNGKLSFWGDSLA